MIDGLMETNVTRGPYARLTRLEKGLPFGAFGTFRSNEELNFTSSK